MRDICSKHSTSLQKLVLDLVSWMLYEVFSLLVCLGVVKNKILYSNVNKFTRHQRLIHYSIKRRTHWEMKRTLVSAPETAPTYDCGALLLGAVLILYFTKKKLKLHEASIKSNAKLTSSKEDVTRNLLILLAMSMEMYYMWHEASVVEMRENHNVVVFKELLMAGDVELNPGPYPPELLARLMNDFAELKPEYYSLGIQLNVPVFIIEEIKSGTGDRFAMIFDYWLHNNQEDLWFEQLYTALQGMRRSDLAVIVEQKYMSTKASSTLTVDDLLTVYEAIFDAKSKWYQIGMLLNVDVSTLDSIEDEEKDNSKKLLRMLKHWLRAGKNRSWEALDKALKSKMVARPDVANKLPINVIETVADSGAEGESSNGEYSLSANNLQYIEWKDSRGMTQELRLYQILAPYWEIVADLVGLPSQVTRAIKRDNRDVEDCIRSVTEKWIEDAPRLNDYKCTLNGMCRLLIDIGQGAASKHLRQAMEANVSSLNKRGSELKDSEKIADLIENEKKIVRKTAHIMVIGFPGNGKSRLLDNLLQKETRKNYSSTDISDSVVVIDVTGKDTTSHNTLIGSGLSWNNSSFEGLTMLQLQQCRKLIRDEKHSPRLEEKAPRDEMPQHEEEAPPDEMPQHSSAAKSIPAAILRGNISRVLEQNNMTYADLESTFSLYIRDTGGQVEFQEVLSILINGPSIFFFVIKANLSLNQPLTLEYRGENGEVINEYKSTTTTRQALVQTLTTIQSTAEPKGIATHDSVVFIIGTHIDKIDSECKNKIIDDLNAELHSLIEDNFDDIVEYNDLKSNKVLFPVSNTHSKREDFEDIQKRVNKKIESSEVFKIEYPLGYLLFSLELRHCKDDVLTRKKCVEIAEKFRITDNEEVDKMLTFLHHRIGIIQYYNTDDLKHLVIKEPQVLFKKLTELMVKTFPSSTDLLPCTTNDLMKGIVKATILEQLFTTVSTKAGTMKSKDFISFLEHLRIAASFYDEEGERYFFMPSVINHLLENKSSDLAVSPKVCPLVIAFKSSCCPKGVFGMTVCHFMSKEKKENQSIFSLEKEIIYRDLVCLDMKSSSAEPEGKVFLSIQTSEEQLPSQTSLKSRPPCSFPSTYIEVRFCPDEYEDFITVAASCDQIRTTLMEGVHHSLTQLNYKESRVGAVESLICHSCQQIHKKESKKGKASVYCKERLYLDKCCSCWFPEAIETPASTQAMDSSTSNQQVPTTNSVESTTAPKQQSQTEASGARGAAQPSSDVFKLLIQHVGIDSSQLDVSPESSQLYDIAKRQGPEWEHCAVKLGLEDHQISDIKENNRHDVEKQRQKALAVWKQQSSFMGTCRRLVEVFLEVKRIDLAEYVCKLVKK